MNPARPSEIALVDKSHQYSCPCNVLNSACYFPLIGPNSYDTQVQTSGFQVPESAPILLLAVRDVNGAVNLSYL